jgi:DNA-binding XRE family transcriptional regulator
MNYSYYIPNVTNAAWRARRLELGYSQQILAEKLGLNPTTICAWETGKTRPFATTAAKLEAMLELDGETVEEYSAACILQSLKSQNQQSPERVPRKLRDIGNLLHEFREKYALSPEEVSKIAKVSAATINRAESHARTPNNISYARLIQVITHPPPRAFSG